jgi:Tol biopolymer transport system component
MAEALTQDILNLVVPCNPKLSPDGRSVVYGSRRKLNHKSGDRATASIWIANTASEKSARQLTSSTSMDLQPKWSPDGTWVAFLSDCAEPGKSSAIYLVQPEAGDGEPKAVTPVEHGENITKYEFSPDGKAIAFLARPEKTEERKAKEKAKDDAIVWGQDLVHTHLWLATIATAAVEPIFNKSSQVVDFSWSPGGTQMAFVTHQTAHIESKFLHGADISIIDVSSGEARKVCHVPGGVWALKDLTWSNSSFVFPVLPRPTR